MLGRAALAALVLVIAPPALAHAQSNPCPPAPVLEPGPPPPSNDRPSWKAYDAAVKAQRAWSAPRMAFGACRRGEIEALGKRVNALGAEINALVDEVSALEKRVRTAREARNAAFRTYGARRNRRPEDWPVAAPVNLPTQTPPCPAPTASSAPSMPDGANANANAMRRADARFQDWAAPLETYIACRKLERQVMIAEHQALADDLSALQAGYASYRAAFNTAVARYQSALDEYAAKLPRR